MQKIIGFILFLVSLIIYFLAPNSYNYNYSLYCVTGYFVSVIIYLLVRKKKNYFDFDCLFFVTYFFVTLFYAAFMFESDPTRYFIFAYDFDENLIPKASGLSLLGINCYIFGALLYRPLNKEFKSEYLITKRLESKRFYLMSFVAFFLYILLGGYSALKSAYGGGELQDAGLSNYIFIFCPPLLFSGIIIDFYNLKKKIKIEISLKDFSNLSLAVTFFIFVMIILTGSRTIPLQILLLIFGLFAILFKPISLYKFFLLICGGILLLAFVGLFRSAEGSVFSLVDLVMDLVICNRNTYVAIEYVNKNGYTLGESMSGSFLASIPLLQNIVVKLFGLNPSDMASSLIITKETLGEVGELGFGTNIIADIFMAFGMPGVIVLMSLLGYFVNRAMDRVEVSIYSLIGYGVMISYAVYIVRAEYFFFMRILVWSFVFVFAAKNFVFKKVTEMKKEIFD